jgi:hypothetical protein
MESNELIPVQTFYVHYHVAPAFIVSLYELQLVELITEDNVQYIAVSHLPHVEKLIRLHTDLELDANALAITAHLLDKIEMLQAELNTLNSKLKVYED